MIMLLHFYRTDRMTIKNVVVEKRFLVAQHTAPSPTLTNGTKLAVKYKKLSHLVRCFRITYTQMQFKLHFIALFHQHRFLHQISGVLIMFHFN